MQTAITTVATSTAMSPEQLTAAIRQEHEAASVAARSALEHALEAGRLLAEAKRKIPHGSWESYVRDECGIAPRTARLYQRLHRHRDRLPNRQHVAELSVRQAARLLEQPRAKVMLPAVAAEPAGELRLRVPEWYRPGHRHFGSHPSGWAFHVWPHPQGEPWVHAVTLERLAGACEDIGPHSVAAGPKRGIRIDAVLMIFGLQSVNGMPTLTDPAWDISARAVDPEAIAASSHFNEWLFTDEEDYRRRGMGIEPKQTAGAGA